VPAVPATLLPAADLLEARAVASAVPAVTVLLRDEVCTLCVRARVRRFAVTFCVRVRGGTVSSQSVELAQRALLRRALKPAASAATSQQRRAFLERLSVTHTYLSSLSARRIAE
jgi:hypothetical protein